MSAFCLQKDLNLTIFKLSYYYAYMCIVVFVQAWRNLTA